jgi:hypothetical protein
LERIRTIARTVLPLLLLAASTTRPAAQDLERYLCEDVRLPFFSAAPQPDGAASCRPVRPNAITVPFRDPKPAGVFRLFVVGESAASILYGGPGGDAFEREGRALLHPGERLEHVNAGMGAYDSSRIVSVAREALEHSPDALVVLSGHNEGRAILCGRAERLAARLREGLLRLRALVDDETALRRARRLRRHEDSLRAMIRAARARRVPVVLCTLPLDARLPPSPEELESAAEPERASASTNALIARVAREEGACLADLHAAFAASPCAAAFADGVHWFPRCNPLAAHVVLSALAACPVGAGTALSAGPAALAAARARALADAASKTSAREESGTVLLYALSALQVQAHLGTPGALSERVLALLSRAEALAPGPLREAARSEAGLRNAVRESFFVHTLQSDSAAIYPLYLRHLEALRKRR